MLNRKICKSYFRFDTPINNSPYACIAGHSKIYEANVLFDTHKVFQVIFMGIAHWVTLEIQVFDIPDIFWTLNWLTICQNNLGRNIKFMAAFVPNLGNGEFYFLQESFYLPIDISTPKIWDWYSYSWFVQLAVGDDLQNPPAVVIGLKCTQRHCE